MDKIEVSLTRDQAASLMAAASVMLMHKPDKVPDDHSEGLVGGIAVLGEAMGTDPTFIDLITPGTGKLDS